MAGNGEIDRLRGELEASERERVRLRSELEQIERSPLGPLIGPGRTLRAIAERRLRRLRGGRRRLPPRLSGSELAWLARRRLRPGRRRGVAPAAPAAAADGWLTPILVDGFGRDGSTALMTMLAASPSIAVDERYPFERRYFTYLWRWSRLPARTDWPGALWSNDDAVSISQEREWALLGPIPWLPRELLGADGDGAGFARRCFEHAWATLSAEAIERARLGGSQPPRFYAEKHSNTWAVELSELPPVRVIALLRDPRDVHASILAFEAKEPITSFSIAEARAGGDRLAGIIDRHRTRMRWIAELIETGAAPVVRSAELARDPAAVAARLAAVLEVEIDPSSPRLDALAERHGSSTELRSEARWRTDLDPAIAERLTDELRPELRALGFEA